jgi:hypothetical protein
MTRDQTELRQSLKRIITNGKATPWEKPMRREAILQMNKIMQILEHPPRADNELSQNHSDSGTATEGR